MIRNTKTPGRNDKCPCKSGKKAKNCCLTKIKLFNNMSLEEKKRFYTESLFVANRLKQLQPVETKTQEKTDEHI